VWIMNDLHGMQSERPHSTIQRVRPNKRNELSTTRYGIET